MKIHNVNFELVVDQDHPDVVPGDDPDGTVCFMGIQNIGNGRILAVALNGDVWRSEDHGVTFEKITSLRNFV